MDIVGTFLWSEAIDQSADAMPRCLDRSLGGFSEQGFKLCKHLLDWIEVWTVRRQEQKSGADGTDGPAHREAF